MMITSHSKAAAAALSAAALLTGAAIAGDSCCKDGSCAKKDEAPNFPGLTGDWGGVRSTLKEHGYEINASYTAELFGNVKGGMRRSAVFDGLLKMSLDVNLEKAVGWSDATFRISGLYPHGTSGTLRNVGDKSIFSNIDAFDTYRLVDFWVEQKFAEGKLALKVGQMRVDDEFGVTDSAALFINSTFGVPNPPYTAMPIADYPVGGLGIRLRVEPLEGLYGMAGIYDGNPSSGDFADPSNGQIGGAARHGTDWALRKSEGTLYTGEVGYQRSNCAYPGAVRAGFLRHTDDFADVSGNGNQHSSSTSSYFVIDQMVWQKAPKSTEGLSTFLRGTMAPKGSSPMDNTIQAGVVYTGLATSDDKVGLAYARNKFSPHQSDSAGNSLNREAITELSYQIPVQPYLRVQPDLQYISHPGGSSLNNNAWVIGVRAILDF